MLTGAAGAIRGAAAGQVMSRVGIDPGDRERHGREEEQHMQRCGGWNTHGVLNGPMPYYLKQKFPKGGMLAGPGADAHLHAYSLAGWV